jgi:hypothetical protein
MLEMGMSDLDNSAVIGVLERMAGVDLRVDGTAAGPGLAPIDQDETP